MIRWTICKPGAIKIFAQAEVALVGGGNSAGQAAVFLAQHAAKVFMLVRRPSLAASMSRYLIDRIDATPNIELRPHTQLTQLHGDLPGDLAAVSWRDHQRGIEEERPIGHVFLFVGADPESGWLEGCGVALDSNGFVLTGQPTAGLTAGHMPASLESSVPGVFAVGERAPRGQAKCRSCREPIARGTWRVRLGFFEEGRFARSGFVHLDCCTAYFETGDAADAILHFSPDLGDADREDLVRAMRPPAAEP